MGKKDKKKKESRGNHDMRYINKQRTLVFSGRTMPARYRHLIVDLRDLLPHHKKENKFDGKGSLMGINDICDMKSCNNCIYFEVHRRMDLYMWVVRAPNGPSAKFLVQNLHTMAEAKLIGNCLKGGRPLLFFDKTFDTEPAYQLIKELFKQVFGTPKGHPKSKPFIDHVFSFFVSDDKIWFRNYQIVEESVAAGENENKNKDNVILVEIGPRFVLNPMRIFSGGFGGATLWRNLNYMPPRIQKKHKSVIARQKYMNKRVSQRRQKVQILKDEVIDPLGLVFKDTGENAFQ